MNEKEFNKFLGKLESTAEGEEFVALVEKMQEMLEETDGDDYFSTQGYRYIVFGE